jgi:NDP-sugar pyrophosphorylase family protein
LVAGFGAFVGVVTALTPGSVGAINLAVKAADFFDFPDSLPFGSFFLPDAAPWDWVGAIRTALQDVTLQAPSTSLPPGVHISGPVYIDPSVRLPPVCTIVGPAYIGPETEIRPGAYVRGNLIVGRGCVLGNSCEFKNALLLDRVKVPHFSYVGDTILGNECHLGAGVICSNIRLDEQDVCLHLPSGLVDTGLRKLGAMLGDGAEVGCNAVLQPGTLLGRRSLVYPLTAFGGFLDQGQIVGAKSDLRRLPRRN